MSEEIVKLKQVMKFLEDAHVRDVREYVKPANWIEFAIIGTATSPRHIAALADDVKHTFGKKNTHIEGDDMNSQWMIANVGNIMIHIFIEESRDYYTLDELWEKTQNNAWKAFEAEDLED